MKDDQVNINVDTLKDIIRSTGMSRGKIEEFILKAPNSLGNAIRRGHIKREKLETLCNFVGVQPEFVIISKAEKKPEQETKKGAGERVIKKSKAYKYNAESEGNNEGSD